MKVFLNNRLVTRRQARVSIFDHGFLYGHAVFETVRASRAGVRDWRDHEARLRRSARAAEIPVPWSRDHLLRAVRQVLAANRLEEATVRLCVSRGEGPLGFGAASNARPTLAVLAHPARGRALEKLRRTGVAAAIVGRRRIPAACLDPRMKTASALALVLARQEARRRGAFEGLLLNADGHLSEGTVSNLFFVRGGTLHTPAECCGLLNGITRRRLIGIGRRASLRVVEGRYRPAALRAAQEIFLTNVTWELLPVVTLIEGRRRRFIGTGRPGPFTRRLSALFRAEIEGEVRRACRAGRRALL